jgi:glucosamine-phosphate N-acetyltransferase
MPLLFRRLTNGDYLPYLSLIRDFRNTTLTEEQFYSTLDVIVKTSDIIVIEEAGELIACGTLLYETKFIHNISTVGHIEDVCIKREHRGKQLGRQLLTYLTQLAKEKGCYKVTLYCEDSNVEFYKKCNFKCAGNQMIVDFRQHLNNV